MVDDSLSIGGRELTNASEVPGTIAEAINRGYNLMAVAVLGLTGLTFGSDLFAEADPMDKIDNTLLAVIGVVAVVWYLMQRNWARRSAVPIYLGVAALVVQIAGVAIEMADPTAIADDIPGMILFVTFVILLVILYSVNGRHLDAGAASPVPPGSVGQT